MKTANRLKFKEIFESAVNLPVNERADFLDGCCAGDEKMRREIEKLLAADEAADGFLESSPFAESSAADYVGNRTRAFVGQKIGAYEIEREIGAGGMGAVFLATRDLGSGVLQKVAVKIVHQGAYSKEIVRRFLIERKILAELEHASIARLIDAGETADGLPFLAMEYIEGVPLDEFCCARNSSIDERLGIFREICAAVAYAHRRLIIHRDLKPGNILVTAAGGKVKLLDFGIAKLLSPDEADEQSRTETLMNLLTPAYAAPEQIRGETITTATDVYSLGVILYELLTGVRPFSFDTKNYQEIVRIICETEPPKPSEIRTSANHTAATGENKNPQAGNESAAHFAVDNAKNLRGDLDNIILKSLQKNPERRYQSVEQFSEDIERYLKGLPVKARPTTAFYRLEKFAARNRGLVAAGVLLFLTLCAGIAATGWQAIRAERERALAEKRFNQVRALANNVVFKYHDGIANLEGSTEVRKMLVGDATAYLDNLSQDAGDDADLMRESANAYIKLADVQGKTFYSNLGDTAGAVENYEKAVELLETLRRNSPEDAAVAGDLRSLYASLSTLEVRRQNWTQAVEYARKALDLSGALAEKEPENKEFQRLLARSYIAYGDAVIFTEGYDAKIRNFRTSNVLLENLMNADAASETVRRTIATSYQRIGTALEEVGEIKREQQAAPEAVQADFAEALEFHRRTLKIAEALHADFPLNEDYKRAVGSTNMNVGSALARMGNGEESLVYFKQALETMREISRKDPENKEAARDFAEALEYSAMGFAAADKTDQAVALFRQSLDTLKPLAVADRTNFEFLKQTHLTYELLGDLFLKAHRDEKALDAYQAGLNFLEQSSNEQTNEQIAVLFSDSYARLGKYYLQTGNERNVAAAKNYFTRSIEKLREMQAAKSLSKAGEYKLDLLDAQLKICESEKTEMTVKN